ncbi:MAG: hypothetical protein P8127_11890 [Acidobacteriota bacterium]
MLASFRLGDLIEEVVQGHLAGRQEAFLTIALASITGNLDRLRFALRCLQDVSGRRNVLETGDLHGMRRSARIDPLPGVVGDCTDTSPGGSAEEVISYVEAPLLDQHGRDDAASLLLAGFEDDTPGHSFGHRLQVLELGDQQDHVQQVVEALVLLRRDVYRGNLSSPRLDQDIVLGQLLFHAVGVGVRFVDLVDCYDQRHVGGPRVGDRLLRLRHDAVICGHHQDHDVGHLGASRAHLGECLVTRCVNEDDRSSVGRVDTRCPDVLGDAASFLLGDATRPDGVEERSLSVVDVAHDSDHRRPRLLGTDQFGALFAFVFDEVFGGSDHRFDFEVRTYLFSQLMR